MYRVKHSGSTVYETAPAQAPINQEKRLKLENEVRRVVVCGPLTAPVSSAAPDRNEEVCDLDLSSSRTAE